MSQTKKDGQPTKVTLQRAKTASKVGAVEVAYKVKSGDYSETFKTEAAALQQCDTLKKRAIKNQEPITATVKEVRDGKDGKEVHSLKIGEDWYK